MFSEIAHLLKPGTRREEIRRAFFASGAMPDAAGSVDELMAGMERQRMAGERPERQHANGTWVKYSDHVLPDGAVVSIRTDITDIKKREEELRRSEAKFRQLAETSLAGVHIHRNFKTLIANQAYADIFGYASPDEIAALDDVRLLIAPRERERLAGYQKRRQAGKTAPSSYEYQGVRKDGTLIWLESHVRFVDWEGEPATQTTLIDITERKNAADALRDSEQYLSGVMNNVADSVATIDEGGTILSFNKAAELAFGYSAEEVVGGRV
jgi:PAS domain S-box-containing protein